MLGPDRRAVPAPPDGAFDRDANLRRLAEEEFDVVVVGGGVTGCGVAVDAAARGLRTALVEADDFASGTSSRSSKLVHGGLRYLDQREFTLVYQALAERQRLLRNAPHLVRPLPFLIPLFGRDGTAASGVAATYATALWLYDLTGGLRIRRRHRRIDAADALRHLPSLRTDRLVASFVYWDAQADDARLTLALARTAASLGAALANHSPVIELLAEPDSTGGARGAPGPAGGSGRAAGVRLGDGTEVRAAVVVNAAGVWSEEVAGLPGPPGAGSGSPRLRPAKGVHVTVTSERLACDHAAVLPVPGERRTVFVVPWPAPGTSGPGGPGRFTYIGTTDTDYDGPLDAPTCEAGDVDGLLAAVNAWTTAALTPADVTATWAGLRPLLADGRTSRSRDLSRHHAVRSSPGGVVSVTGGKLTTYRRMAADATDAVVAAVHAAATEGGRASDGSGARGRRRGRRVTTRLALVGAGVEASLPARGGVLGVPSVRHHLFGRYGTEAAGVAGLCATDPSLAGPLVAGLPYLRAEAVWAARHEMAVTLEDVLSRRTRALLLDRDASARAAPAVATLLAGELGWDAEREAAEVAALVAVVARRRSDAAGSTAPGGVPLRTGAGAGTDTTPPAATPAPGTSRAAGVEHP